MESNFSTPAPIVGVLATRTTNLILGVLGALLSDSAYVPIDSKYPPERIAYMIHDTSLKVLLVDVSLRAKLGEVLQVLEEEYSWKNRALPFEVVFMNDTGKSGERRYLSEMEGEKRPLPVLLD